MFKNRLLLETFLDQEITKVRREIWLPDFESLDPKIRDEESDGPIELTFCNGVTIGIFSNTEEMSIEIKEGPIAAPSSAFVSRDLTENSFWLARVGKPIERIDVLQSIYDSPLSAIFFGVELFCLGADSFVVEYISDEDHTDQIRITGPYAGPDCRRTRVERHINELKAT